MSKVGFINLRKTFKLLKNTATVTSLQNVSQNLNKKVLPEY